MKCTAAENTVYYAAHIVMHVQILTTAKNMAKCDAN
jgi:hypothetical protein